jgi:hypothetical protein
VAPPSRRVRAGRDIERDSGEDRGMRLRWLVLVLLAACGSTPTETPDAAPPTDAADPAVVETRSLTIGPVTVPAGSENTICVVLDLGNEVPRMLRSIRTELTAGTHHVIVSRTTAPVTTEPYPCGAFAGGGDLFIAQQSEAHLSYPAGAGLPIAAHQSIHLEMHYLNAQPTDPLDIAGTVHLDLAEDVGELRPIELLFTGETALFIPAGGMADVTSFHALEPGDELFATTAHTHQWGRAASVELMASADATEGTVLHESTDWAERPIDEFEPITITAGQGLRLRCAYHNESDHDVSFGLGAEDEMCFLWAHLIQPRQ